MQVFTGTKGVLKLRGKMLWLVKDSIPVLEYLWKLVVDANCGDSIVFVPLNNSHLQHLTRSVTLCIDVSDQAGWGEKLMDREEIENVNAVLAQKNHMTNNDINEFEKMLKVVTSSW